MTDECICVWTVSREGIEEILPSEAHRLATGRLHVSVTNSTSGRNHILSRFSSREELIQVTTLNRNLYDWFTSFQGAEPGVNIRGSAPFRAAICELLFKTFDKQNLSNLNIMWEKHDSCKILFWLFLGGDFSRLWQRFSQFVKFCHFFQHVLILTLLAGFPWHFIHCDCNIFWNFSRLCWPAALCRSTQDSNRWNYEDR